MGLRRFFCITGNHKISIILKHQSYISLRNISFDISNKMIYDVRRLLRETRKYIHGGTKDDSNGYQVGQFYVI